MPKQNLLNRKAKVLDSETGGKKAVITETIEHVMSAHELGRQIEHYQSRIDRLDKEKAVYIERRDELQTLLDQMEG